MIFLKPHPPGSLGTSGTHGEENCPLTVIHAEVSLMKHDKEYVILNYIIINSECDVKFVLATELWYLIHLGLSNTHCDTTKT